MDNQRFEIVVRAILKNPDGDVLLVKRSKKPHKDKWILPGGKVEFGEKSNEAIIREIKEEINVHFFPIPRLFNDDFHSVPGVHCLVLYYEGDFEGKISLNSNENSSFHFFAKGEILESTEIGFDHQEILLGVFDENKLGK